MARKYTKISESKEEIIRLREEGKTLREAATLLGYTYNEVKEFVSRENRKKRLVEAGYILRPKGRPRKDSANEDIAQKNRIISLEMTVELLRNFLSGAGRR